MSIDQIIDSFKGDERSKRELKNAHRKARNLGFIVFFCMLAICIPFAYEKAFDWPFGLSDKIMLFFMVALFPSIFTGFTVGVLSTQFFARHIKIILPEALTPTIEIENRKY